MLLELKSDRTIYGAFRNARVFKLTERDWVHNFGIGKFIAKDCPDQDDEDRNMMIIRRHYNEGSL